MTSELPPADHTLEAGAETCHWGFFEAGLSPRLTVAPGERVRIETVSGGPAQLPPEGFTVSDALREVHAKLEPPITGHILTGPVAIEGAEPGDLLEVKIEGIALAADWGYTFFKPLGGTLPDAFPEFRQVHIALDIEAGRATTPWGTVLPTHPFFGVLGVSPPASWGRCTSIIPRPFGGNLDNKELVPGTSLFLPVYVPGANFSCGDGHGAQGDGEVCGTAIETALTGVFSFAVHKGKATARPFAITPTHIMTMATGPDLDRCAEEALGDLIAYLAQTTRLSREDAYMLASLAADLRVTQTVNQHKGVHCMIARDIVAQS
ncbi:acetamidase/formamidase family protein [Acuticoccus sp. M5D2P5]|uniref:acetamidase/formamidase family protein n=1 Tax=Acuticoccus kalidii TaxID=2910977 RepID=UPI001F3FF0DA|nr:acetamidase/formamidase family protein [Acuticoccus kalidii]MCF3934582.1 acetamidase/formamidase family protein [Acuticoccus kalidii]